MDEPDGDNLPVVKQSPKAPAAPVSAAPPPGFTPHVGEAGEYRAGMIVQNPEYGLGQVLEVSGHGALRKVRIRFQSHGLRVFLAAKAKLSIVHPG